MMATIVSLIAVIGALVLATSNLRGKHLPTQTMLKYGLIWGAIIAALTLALSF